MSALKIRTRHRRGYCREAGGYTGWTEVQVVEGRRVLSRHDLESQAARWIAEEEERRRQSPTPPIPTQGGERMNATLEAALEHGLSNFDRVIPDGLDEALRDGGECDYAGRNFYGRVWHENDKFKCKVWRHKMPGETLEADSLPELMTVVSNRWGYD